MAPIHETIEIARPPEAVFAYIDDLTRHAEWQESIVSTRVDTGGPTRVGTHAVDVRRMGSREMTIGYEITEHDPPRAFAFRGIDGPIRVVGRGTLEPVGDGSSTRLRLELDFTSHGIMGKLLLPMVRGQARKQVPSDHLKLKERLEKAH